MTRSDLAHDKDLAFIERLNALDPLQIILRGHLYIEEAIVSLLKGAFYDKDALDLNSFTYPKKVDLLVAMGFISKEQSRAYIFFKSLTK